MAYSQVKTLHPCADSRLGQYNSTETLETPSRPKKFVTVFWYDGGAVLMDNDWKWHTLFSQVIPGSHDLDHVGLVEAVEHKFDQLLGIA